MNLIGYAPKNTKVVKSLEHSKVKTLDFKEYPWLELPSGLANLTSLDLSSCRSLQNIDGLGNLAKLTSLDLSGCYFLKNIDGLANLPNLTTIDLSAMGLARDYVENVDSLVNLTNLTTLDLSGRSNSLHNVNGLANLPNLSSLNLEYSNEVQPKPSKEVMTTREEVAAYQEEIKKSMK